MNDDSNIEVPERLQQLLKVVLFYSDICKENTDFDVITETTPWFSSFSKSCRRIIASAISVT